MSSVDRDLQSSPTDREPPQRENEEKSVFMINKRKI